MLNSTSRGLRSPASGPWPASFLEGRKPWAELCTYVGLVVMVITTYPTLRMDALAGAYLAIEVVALAQVLALAIAWGRRREALTLPALCIFVLGAVDAVKVSGPLVHPFRDWALTWPVHAITYTTLIGFQGGALWLTRRR